MPGRSLGAPIADVGPALLVDGIFRVDASGRYLEVSARRGLERCFMTDLYLGRTIHEVLPPIVAARVHAAIRRALESGTAQSIVTTLHVAGSLRALETRIFPLEEGTLMVSRDVTSLVFEPMPLATGNLPTLAEVEASYVRRVLERVGGNKSLAARILGVGRKTLYRMLERLDADAGQPERRLA